MVTNMQVISYLGYTNQMKESLMVANFRPQPLYEPVLACGLFFPPQFKDTLLRLAIE